MHSTYTFAQLALPVISLGGMTVVLREGAESDTVGREILQLYTTFIAAAAALWFLLALTAVPIPDWIRFGILIGSLDALQQIATSYLQSRDKIWQAFSVATAKTVLFIICIVIAISQNWTLHEMLWLQIVQGAIVGAVPAAMLGSIGLSAQLKDGFRRHRSSIVYGLKTVPHTFALWAISNSDRLFLGTFVSKAALGTYILPYTLAQCVLLLHSGYAAVFSVNVARNEGPWLEKGKIERLLLQAGLASCGMLALACVVALAEMRFIRFIQWGEAPVFLLAGVISAGMVLSLGYLTFASFALRRRMTGTISRMTAISAVVSAPCALVLVLLFAGWGAAISVMLGYAVMAVLYYRNAVKFLPELRKKAIGLVAIAVFVCGLHVAVGGAVELAAQWLGVY